MLLPSESPRTTMYTVWAYLLKYIAACPAEFPAPTMNTSCPVTEGASVIAAP